ncbi:MAG: efflux RND transporter permease subunit, partial [Campylobacterales bacterium]|nr:efflux RND transporter permease subunit [Campylobacterales bacterium]
MHGLTRFFIHNPVAANLIMAFILIAGYFSVTNIRIEGFPKIPADSISIETSFYGAYATQIDKQITRKIEQALEGTDGIKNIWAVSNDGYSSITVQKTAKYDIQKLLNSVRTKVGALESLPKKAGRPIISVGDFDFPALYIQLYGKSEQEALQKLFKKLRKELLSQPEISKVKTWGMKSSEIAIEIEPITLAQYGLSIEDIVGKIRESSLFFETGTLKTTGGKISLKADQQAYYKRDYEEIPIIKLSDGTQLLLKDIGKVQEKYVDDGIEVRFNQSDTIGMEILIGRKENLLKISEAVKRVTTNFEKQLPTNIKLAVWGDSSNYISERLKLLKDNAIDGLLIVTILLALFLNVKLAFWVAMGIPISIAGTMAVMGTSWVDYSLNDITTLGMIIALGILVDDAVVVGESIFEERKKTPDPRLGTELGVNKIATATIFGVLTTVAAFAPMMTINNSLGQVLASFAGVVIFALLFSLFESKFILPAHLAEISLEKSSTKGVLKILEDFWSKLQKKAKDGLESFKTNTYLPALRWSLKNSYAVLIFFISSAILGIGLIVKGQIATVFYPEVPGQMITIKLEMDKRASKDLLNKNIQKIEKVAKRINEKYKKELLLENKPIHHILLIVTGSESAEIYAELTPSNQRENLGTMEILKQWQKEVGELEGAIAINYSGSEDMAGGFQINLYSEDKHSLHESSKKIIEYLDKIDGVWNVRDSLKEGKQQIQLRLKPEAQYLGFTTETLAVQIGNLFGGAEAQKIQRDSEEIKVIVKRSESSAKTLSDLMNTKIKSPQGNWHSLLSIAQINSGYATDTLTRKNGKTINTIKAFIDKSSVSPSEVSQGIFQEIAPLINSQYPEVTISSGGEIEEMEEMQGQLTQALIIAAIVIYILIAIPLQSYWQPFIIMSVIPFGFV